MLLEVVFPAHAGMNRRMLLLPVVRLCVPRPRGDEPIGTQAERVRQMCSPPTRG